MQKFSIGILSWHSKDVLINTLKSYHDVGLIGAGPYAMSNDVTIYFQEITDEDIAIAKHFETRWMGTRENIGIGQAFLKLANAAKNDNILLLEHDWQLIENHDTTEKRLEQGMNLLEWGYDCVRYRSRENPGHPHFSRANYDTREKALAYHDPEIDLTSPHLLDSVHFYQDPSVVFPGLIGKQMVDDDTYFVSTSRYANFSNNPCLYKKEFYLKAVKPFVGKGIDLEGKISHWWGRQNFNVAHGDSLFSHNDFLKYPNKN